MTKIWERVESALDDLGLPLGADRYMAASGDLPDMYLVYTLVTSPPEQHADDAETLRSYTIQVSVFSRSGLTAVPDITGAMLAAGFKAGPARKLDYSEKTRHYGLAMDFNYLSEGVEL